MGVEKTILVVLKPLDDENGRQGVAGLRDAGSGERSRQWDERPRCWVETHGWRGQEMGVLVGEGILWLCGEEQQQRSQSDSRELAGRARGPRWYRENQGKT